MIAAPPRVGGSVRQALSVGAVAADGGALPPVALPGTEPFLRDLAGALPNLQCLPPPAGGPWATLDDRIGGDVAAWLDGFGGGADGGVWLIGLGEGGLAALCAAALWPDAVAGLALVGTPVDFHPAPRRPSPGRLPPGRPSPGGPSPGSPDPFADRHAPEAVGRFVGCWRLLAGRWSGPRFRHETPPRQVPAPARPGEAGGPDEAGRPSPDGLAADGLAADWLSSFHVANGLMTGTLAIDGLPVDLGRVTAPVLNLVPGPADPAARRCRALGFVVGSRDYEEVAPFEAGDLLDGPARRAVVLGRLTGWLARREAGAGP